MSRRVTPTAISATVASFLAVTGSAKISCGSFPIGKRVVRRVLRLIDPSLL